jgi:hypothetical protein
MSTYYLSNYHYYPAPIGGAWQLAKIGATVGACGAGAVQLRRYRRGEATRQEALAATAQVALKTGLATGAAGLVAGQFRSPTLQLLATLAVGTAAMYALDSANQEKSA